ncbi:MAG TPA: hypothetical protein VHO70_08655 [Chitinispirillaceae bacterium]|nr:hypothetical protein [Chitinispirillaceae bacterium]
MKIKNTVVVAFIFTLSIRTLGVTPVHVGRVSIDTSLYYGFGCYYVPGPSTNWQDSRDYDNGQMILQSWQKRGTKQVDIYSFNGKIGTTIIPIINEVSSDLMHVILSRTMVDDDDGWEALVNYHSENNTNYKFIVYEEDGTVLLADSGSALYGFDGNNTYVVQWNILNTRHITYDSWRFRTNISAESPKSLAKTKSIQQSPMQIYGLSGGDYRVTLSPSSGNQINFQMFDLLGRCVFDKQIGNLNRPVTFTVPEENVPNSPFIAKVNDGNNSVVKKQIPVK